MKICTKCKLEKNDEDFSFKNKIKFTRQSSCKECFKKVLKNHYNNNKKYYIAKSKKVCKTKLEYTRKLKASNPCVDCGKYYAHYVMEFDHKEDKNLCVSTAVNRSWKILLNEIKKCDIVCSNCHAERTWMRLQMAT